MTLSRRKFLAGGLGMFGAVVAAEQLFTSSAHAANPSGKQLVLIQLSGGNDGLNTVIPYGTGAYYDARPQISVAQKDVLHLNNALGLHPAMTALNDLYLSLIHI